MAGIRITIIFISIIGIIGCNLTPIHHGDQIPVKYKVSVPPSKYSIDYNRYKEKYKNKLKDKHE